MREDSLSKKMQLGVIPRLLGAAVLSFGVIGAAGCSAQNASQSAPEPSSQDGIVLAMEYKDGGDMYDHESVEVTDSSLIAEGTQFVNGLGEENTYIYKGYAHGDNAHYSMYSLYTELITDDDGLLTAVNLTSGDDTWSNKWGDLGANPEINGHLPEGVTFTYTEKDGSYIPELTVEEGTEAEKAGYTISAIYLYNVSDDLTTVGSDVEGRRGTTHFEYDASISLDAAIVDDDDDDEDEAAASTERSGRDGSESSAASGDSERSGKGERSGGEERSGGQERSGDNGTSSESTASSSAADETSSSEPVDYSYDPETGAITIEGGNYNLIQIQYKFGTENLFNEFIAIDDDANALKYVEENFPETNIEVIDQIDNTGVTNRTKWTYSMLSLMAQREFASWGSTFEDVSLYTGGNDGEIGDIDTISGATKTSVPFQSALNQAIEAGYVTGVADEVTVTIDGGDPLSDGINATEVPQDQTIVTVNDAGQYVVDFNFPAGVDEADENGSVQHAISPTSIEIYSLGDEELGTLGVWNLGKGTSGFTPVETYSDSSKEPGDVNDSYITYVSDWDYPYLPTLTVKDPSITHVVIYYTIGHETLGIAYDLEQMAAAHEVEEMIEALDVADAAAVEEALAAYENLSYDVVGTVKNSDKLLAAAAK